MATADAESGALSPEGERLLAALLAIAPDDAARLREQLPPRRRPPAQDGPSRDWGADEG